MASIAHIAHLLSLLPFWDKDARQARWIVEDQPAEARMVRVTLSLAGRRFELPFLRSRLCEIIEEGRNNLRLWERDMKEELRKG